MPLYAASSIPRALLERWKEGSNALGALPTWVKAALWLQALVSVLSMVAFIGVIALIDIRASGFVNAVVACSFPGKAQAIQIMGETFEKTGSTYLAVLTYLLMAAIVLCGLLIPIRRHKTR